MLNATERNELIDSFARYRKHPKHEEVVKEAAAKGFKPAPVEMSLAQPMYVNDIYKWRGGCWVKHDFDTSIFDS